MATARKRRGGTRASQRLRRQVLAEEPLCWLRLEGCTIVATQVDHIIAVSDAPHLEFCRANCRGACRNCNQRRGRLPVGALPDHTSSRALDFFS